MLKDHLSAHTNTCMCVNVYACICVLHVATTVVTGYGRQRVGGSGAGAFSTTSLSDAAQPSAMARVSKVRKH